MKARTKSVLHILDLVLLSTPHSQVHVSPPSDKLKSHRKTLRAFPVHVMLVNVMCFVQVLRH